MTKECFDLIFNDSNQFRGNMNIKEITEWI